MNDKNKWLTIGQFAKLHSINKKTLMWYDQIGLFKPAKINHENGYRYYNYYQSPVLETILLLRELDVSINDIQEFMNQRSASSLKILLKEKLTELDHKVFRLQTIRKTLDNYYQNMIMLETIDTSQICIVEQEERYLVTVDIDQSTSFEQEVELITAETTKYHLERLHEASYGSMIAVEALKKGQFDAYSKLFIEIPALTQKTQLHIQPKGRYLRAFHQGGWDTIPLCYQSLIDYAHHNGIVLTGFAYEKGINEIVVDRVEDYIIQIEIPIKETTNLS